MFYLQGLFGIFWFSFSAIVTMVASLFRPRHPANGVIFTTLFTRVIHSVLGTRVEVHNRERLTAYPSCIYVGNHQSNLDILTHAVCYPPRTVAIGKKELIWIPFFGLIFYLTGNIMIDRKNREKSVETFNEVTDRIRRGEISVYIFPEGTRSRQSGTLLPFKKGAFHLAIGAQVPIVPVVASSMDPLVDVKNRRIKKGVVHIQVLEPIPTKGLTDNDVDRLLEETRNRMQITLSQLKTEILD